MNDSDGTIDEYVTLNGPIRIDGQEVTPDRLRAFVRRLAEGELNIYNWGNYTNPDLIGCELGGVLKNIIAIAVGMGDGQGAGDNTRSALITRGLAEITRKNKERVVSLSANIGAGTLVEQINAIQEKVDAMNIPAGYRVEYSGEFENLEESFGSS